MSNGQRTREASGDEHASAATVVAHAPSKPKGGDPLVGTVLAGRYRLLEAIGTGGMGAVYRAEQIALRRHVAVKILHAQVSSDPELRARFEREALSVARMEHPNVVAAIDFGTEDGRFFMAMEFVEGATLRRVLDRDGRLPPRRAVHVARQIASTLSRAHSLGIVHRDLKPENVLLVAREGDPDFVKVIDFGVAKVAAEREGGPVLTQAGTVIGTLNYMAPEQALGGRVDHRADLFALGVMTFEMLAGVRPFEVADLGALVARHVADSPPRASAMAPPGALAAAVDPVLARMLAGSPGARYATAVEFVTDLEAALGLSASLPSAPAVAAPASMLSAPAAPVAATANTFVAAPAAAPVPSRSPAWLPLAAGALVVLLGAAVGLTYVLRHKPASTATPTTPTQPPAPSTRATTPAAQPSAANSPSPAARPTPTPAPTGGMPAELAARLEAYRSRADIARTLDRARHGYLTLAIQSFEAQRGAHRDAPFPAYFLGGLYARVPNGLGPSLDRYREALREEPGLAYDPTLIHDVVRAYLAGQHHADETLRGPLAATAGDELRSVVASSPDAFARERAQAALDAIARR